MNINLDGKWLLRQDGQSECIEAQVPGCVHTDLLAAGKIVDPYVGENEEGLRWIFEKRWIYKRTFQVPEEFLKQARMLLCCDGLDTIAHLILNGKPLGNTNNMFRRWEFDVRALLVPGSNHLEIQFDSPVAYIEARQKVYPMTYPKAPQQVASFSQIRKAAYSFGWDWGPCLPTSGIWQPISLQAFDTGRLVDVAVQQEHAGTGEVKLAVDVTSESASGTAAMHAHVLIKYEGKVIDQGTCPVNDSHGSVNLCVETPHLWWPRGMGDQPLYEVTVQLLDANSTVIDTWVRRIGLRTFRLETGEDQWGHAFSFVVNGVPFFVKGTNWIPADALVTRVTSGWYRQLLTAAAEANMNMIRVWGGGIYEPDVFYDICDELGLCVWQDFMFACAPYPLEDPEFVQNAEAEMVQQIKRLRHHASLALWCGNNEIEFCGFVAIKGDSMHIPLKTYRWFFEERIGALLAAHSPEHSHWPGSPYKEEGEVYDPDVPSFPPHRGDAHIWSVWHMKQPFEAYRQCLHRFISEFGFQSFPEPTSVDRFTEPDDRDIDSPVMRHHQRSGSGNTLIMEYMLEWFRQPRDFEATLWCSQLLQGVAIKLACEHWRRAMPRTMGTLIWQLNDAWPAASWSSIDYFGQWKAMHFMARRFYAPLLVSAVEDASSGVVEVHVTSDLSCPADCSLRWRLTNLEGHLLRQDEIQLSAAPQADTLGAKLDFGDDIARHGVHNLLLWLDLRTGGESASSNLVFFARPRQLELPDPELTHTVEQSKEGSFVVKVTAKMPALWAWIELPGTSIHCSDNFMHLEAGSVVEIIVRSARSMTVDQFAGGLRVRSLFDTYRATS